MKRRRIRASLFVILFLVFLFLMDYPYLSRIYNDMVSGEVIASYGKSEDTGECAARRKWAQAYNRYLAGEGECPSGETAGIKGFPDLEDGSGVDNASDMDIPWEAAARILCMDDSAQAGWIAIEALDLMLPLYVGTDDDALRNGAGILERSSLPVGGEGTHTCISAHRGLPDKTLFTNLDLLGTGDLIHVHTLDQTLCYEVTDTETVEPTQTEHLAIRKGEDILTLITCTPYGINTHRLYVHARRCEDRGKDEAAEKAVKRGLFDPLLWKLWWWVPATAVLLLFMIILVIRFGA